VNYYENLVLTKFVSLPLGKRLNHNYSMYLCFHMEMVLSANTDCPGDLPCSSRYSSWNKTFSL